jgi:hypothetical protein
MVNFLYRDTAVRFAATYGKSKILHCPILLGISGKIGRTILLYSIYCTNQGKKRKKFGKGIYLKTTTLREDIGTQRPETAPGLFELGCIRGVIKGIGQKITKQLFFSRNSRNISE